MRGIKQQGRCCGCHGIPGCGKTILASAIVEHLKINFSQVSSSDVLIAYYYFRFDDMEKQNAQNCLSSILAQTTSKQTSIDDCVKSLFEISGRVGKRPETSQLLHVLREVFQKYDKVFLILDALDECPEDGNHQSQLLEAIGELHSSTQARILCLSRDISNIRHTMESAPNTKHLPIRDDLVNADIRRFGQEAILSPRFRKWPATAKDEVAQALADKAGGMYAITV